MSELNNGPVAAHDEVVPLEEPHREAVEHAGGKGRIRHGQTITVDGDQGLVILEPGN